MYALDRLRMALMRSGIVMPSGDDMRSCADGAACIFGFTLIELLAAIAIVSVLAAIAAPSFVDGLCETSRIAAQITDNLIQLRDRDVHEKILSCSDESTVALRAE